jgi:hypothetical protein
VSWPDVGNPGAMESRQTLEHLFEPSQRDSSTRGLGSRPGQVGPGEAA